ncbi:hypothetical protein MMC2321_01607 [Chitinophaga sp. MM2321]
MGVEDLIEANNIIFICFNQIFYTHPVNPINPGNPGYWCATIPSLCHLS